MTETNSPMGDTNDAPVAQEPPLLESMATEAPSRLQSMALGDTTQEREQRDITNWPALIGLAAFFVFIGYLGIAYLAMVLGLVIMIFLHELGHFMTAKWSGMKATQFFLGFGPTLFSRQRGEVEWGIKALPFGAFVRIVGMSNLDPYDPADADKAYINKSYPRRMWVITAGSVMHFIQAAIILVFAVSIVGVRDAAVIDGALEDAPRPWTIGEISQLETGETPSIEAGLEVGDRIVSIDGMPLQDFVGLAEYVRARPGEEVALEIARGDETFETSATLVEVATDDGGTIGFLGVAALYDRQTLSPSSALGLGVEVGGTAITFIPQRFFSPETWANLGSLVLEGPEDVSITSDEAAERPISLVGAVRISGQVAEIDWALALLFLAQINIFVGILNLIPLLPLDGGHAAIATYERIRSRKGRAPYRADITKLLPLTYAVVLVFGFIGLTTIWLDIVRPIS